ncbi:MAG TPA: hypothetical protein PLG96_02240, partial [Flexilinea sp.]|nr:hypothetical protein [Flexilinea sp.]
RTCIIGNDANIAAAGFFDVLLVFRSSDKASLSEEMTLLPNNDTSSSHFLQSVIHCAKITAYSSLGNNRSGGGPTSWFVWI